MVGDRAFVRASYKKNEQMESANRQAGTDSPGCFCCASLLLHTLRVLKWQLRPSIWSSPLCG
jgi:hypothetical protein